MALPKWEAAEEKPLTASSMAWANCRRVSSFMSRSAPKSVWSRMSAASRFTAA